MIKVLSKFVLVFAIAFAGFLKAGDINWSGRYLLEGQYVKNPGLSNDSNEYSFLSHHLILNPQFIAGDGIVIHSRFDIFNNSSYPNSSVGEFFGGSDTMASSTSKQKHGSGELESETLVVNELYLTYANPFGYFIAGRAPVHFGTGLTYNSGKGEFDHWFDTRDLVGYKLIFGNLYLFPMYAKIREGDAELDDDVQEWMLQAGYENLDTDLDIGLMYTIRKSNPGGMDVTAATDIYNQTGSTVSTASSLDVKTFSLYVKKRAGPVVVKLETAMQSGSSGLQTAGGDSIDIEANALVGEIKYESKGSMDVDLKAGLISGDDRGSKDYEGFLVDRNFDVGLIMFNYMLGNTATGDNIGNENYIRATTNGQKADVGYLSNAMFIAPGVHWRWSDKSGMKGRFLWAQLEQEQYSGQDKDLGYELDFSFYYKPYDRVTLQLDTGYLFTGKAFAGNPLSPNETEDAYAIMTKAAISF